VSDVQPELLRAMGRIEKVVDTIDTKLDGHAETIARHDVRIAQLERIAQRTWERVGLWITVFAALAAAILPQVIHR
jgi:hypothetical protein